MKISIFFAKFTPFFLRKIFAYFYAKFSQILYRKTENFCIFRKRTKSKRCEIFFAERFPFFAGDPRHHLHCTTNTFVLAVLRHHALSLKFLSIVGNPVSMYLFHL